MSYSPRSAALIGMAPTTTDVLQRALLGLVSVVETVPPQPESTVGGSWDYLPYQQPIIVKRRQRSRDDDEAVLLALL